MSHITDYPIIAVGFFVDPSFPSRLTMGSLWAPMATIPEGPKQCHAGNKPLCHISGGFGAVGTKGRMEGVGMLLAQEGGWCAIDVQGLVCCWRKGKGWGVGGSLPPCINSFGMHSNYTNFLASFLQ